MLRTCCARAPRADRARLALIGRTPRLDPAAVDRRRGLQFRDARVDQGLTQRQLSELSGVP